MDDLVKIVAFGALAAFLLGGGMVSYRVVNDPTLLYIVVIGGMLIIAISATGLTFLMYRHAAEARRLQLDASLTSARIMRTLDGVSRPQLTSGGGGDVLTQLIAAAGGGAGDVVDGTVTYPAQLPDDDSN